MEHGHRYIALTGLPRSGSTLCCHLVNAAPQGVALFEPMQVTTLDADDRARATGQVLAYFEQQYASLLADGTAETRHRGGKVPDNPFGGLQADGTRMRDVEHGYIRFDKPLSDGFVLMIKHNAAYAALLPELADVLPVFGLVRNPLSMLASWNSISIPVSHGRLPAGERLDPALASRLDGEPDLVSRQLIIMDWFFGRYLANLPAERILRYESIVASQGHALFDALGLQAAPMPMRERNASSNYAAVDVRGLHARLADSDGIWRRFYAQDEVDAIHERLAGTR